MKNKQAFTLIELLVVVLIIGILAAVALPQYQKAVEKSKATQALTLLKSVYQAAKAYKLANGTWPQSFDELPLEIPWNGTTKWVSSNFIPKANEDWSLQINGQGVSVGRLSGKYQGAAFGIWETPWQSAPQAIPADEIVCIEGHADNGILRPFTLTRGDYCAKLFKGTFLNTSHMNKYFKLP